MNEAFVTYRNLPVPKARWFDHFLEAGYKANNAAACSRFSELADSGAYLVSVVDGGPDNTEVIAIADDKVGGWLKITTNDADNDLLNIQLNGEAFKLDRDLAWEMDIELADVSAVDWFFGLAISDVDVLGACTDLIGFRCPDATGDIDIVAGKDSTETVTDCGENVADATAVRLRFEYRHTEQKAYFFVNGIQVGTISTNLPDDECLSPVFEVRNSGAAANTAHFGHLLTE